jgi:hypothetical protein
MRNKSMKVEYDFSKGRRGATIPLHHVRDGSTCGRNPWTGSGRSGRGSPPFESLHGLGKATIIKILLLNKKKGTFICKK